MDYKEYVDYLLKTSDGRLYLLVLADTLKNDSDIRSLQYLYACVKESGNTEMTEKVWNLLSSLKTNERK